MRRWAATFFAGLGALYFAAHALAGERGVVAWTSMRAEISALETDLEDLNAEIARLEDRTGRLRSETLDLDFLEERARAIAGVGRPGEVVIAAETLPVSLVLHAVDARASGF